MTHQASSPTNRKPTFLIAGAIAILIAMACAFLFWTIGQERGELTPTIQETMVRYSFTLENQSNQTLEQVAFKAFAPVSSTPFQQVQRIETSLPHQVEADELGNQTLVFNLEQFPPYGQKTISISVWLKTADLPAFENALTPEHGMAPLIEADDEYLVEALGHIDSDQGQVQWLRSASQWVHETLEDVGYVAEDRGARYALQEKKGDCTEFAHALIAMGRSKDIPALLVAGFPVQGGNSILQASDYHNWVLANADRRWRVADPHAGKFETDSERYIAYRLVPKEAGDGMNSQRFFAYDPRIRVRMN